MNSATKTSSWIKLSEVAAMTGGALMGADAELKAVSIDTRKVQPDDLFIAIKGERFDAHDFVGELSGKVAGALVNKEIKTDVPQVLVKDTKLALAQLASAWRDQFKKPVIGLTGSNGKTTLKEMLSAILSQQAKGNVLATLGNFNNDIGMPLTLLRIRKEHDVAIIEMGANHFGEIDFLTKISKPTIAVLNNAGPAHLEGFGDIEGVAKAKGEIFNGLADGGIAVINADDDYAEYWLDLLEGQEDQEKQVLTFGMNKQADIQGDYRGNGQLLIQTKTAEQEIQLNLLGKHNAMNALAATAVATALDIDLQTVKIGLESLASVPGRLALVEGLNGSKLLDDTYNANPGSVNAAIDALTEASDTRILVLGDMGELGDDTDALHADIGVKAKQSGIEKMFCLGDYSANACEKFGSPENAFSDLDELINSIKNEINGDMTTAQELPAARVTILVKGSRSARMERVVNALRSAEC